MLDQVCALRHQDGIVMVGRLVIDQLLDVRIRFLSESLEHLREYQLRAIHVTRLQPALKPHLPQALPPDFAHVDHDADAVHELPLLDLAKVLRLRLPYTAARAIATDKDVEKLGVAAILHAEALSGLPVVRALHGPRRPPRLRVGGHLGVVVLDAQAEVTAEQQHVLQQQHLQLIDANGGSLGLCKYRIACLAAHEVLPVEPREVVPHKVPHVGAVDPVGEPELLERPLGVPDLSALFDHGHLVAAQAELDGEPEADRPAADDQHALRHDARVLVRLAEIQPLAVAVGGPTALELVQALPHPGPLPVAPVSDYSLQLLIREDRVGVIVRRAADRLHHDAPHRLVVEAPPGLEDLLPAGPRRLGVEEGPKGLGLVLGQRGGRRRLRRVHGAQRLNKCGRD
mmetsp:Transcript_101878/g.311605  ORF Transcript_101878/g.311605 Transcript_101878/m.311605 type:complete len:399 (-) Transcript_101878:90-1286(-)